MTDEKLEREVLKRIQCLPDLSFPWTPEDSVIEILRDTWDEEGEGGPPPTDLAKRVRNAVDALHAAKKIFFEISPTGDPWLSVVGHIRDRYCLRGWLADEMLRDAVGELASKQGYQLAWSRDRYWHLERQSKVITTGTLFDLAEFVGVEVVGK